MVHVTRHAKKRLKERSGLQKGSMARISEKAFIQGINYRGYKRPAPQMDCQSRL